MSDEEKRTEEELESAKTEESSAEPSEATSEDSSAAAETEAAVEAKPEADVAAEAAHAHEVKAAPEAQEEHHDHGHAVHGHDAHDHGAHGDEHFAHTAPAPMLLGVFGALIVLTILTVAVTAVDLGANGNLVVAMVIATVKAALVMGFFMHMFWDSKFNVVAFTSSFLFVILFLAMTLTDRGEYQDTMNQFEADKKAIELAK